MNNQNLIDAAMVLREEIKRTDSLSTSGVSSALETENGEIITGVCIDAACGIGFCAEHAAIAELAKQKSMLVKKIVALDSRGVIIPPCGRCRELIFQIDSRNINTKVIIALDKEVSLSELLPSRWQDLMF